MTLVCLLMVIVSCVFNCGHGTPVPLPGPKSLADPQLILQQLPRSAQQFTMYRQLTQPYPPGAFPQYAPGTFPQYPPGVPVRQSAPGQPLIPIAHYSYNITHPARRPGIVLTHHQLQHLSQQQRLPVALQSQQRPAYSPVVIGNPNAINSQFQPQNFIQGTSDTATAELQVPLQDFREREPEDLGIGFRISNQKKKYNGPPGSTSRIVFDQQRPSQQILNRAIQYPEKILFGNGQGGPNQLGSLPQPYAPLQFNPDNASVTSKPPIQVPYVTTLSPLQDLLQRKRTESQPGFRTLLASANPGLRASLLSTINQNNQLFSSPRTGRVQNFVVPNFSQTPAGTQLLQNPRNQQQSGINNFNVPLNLFSNQGQGRQTSFPSPGTQGTFSNQLNLSFIRGTAVTPDNQRALGQFIFNDPNGNDPNNPNTNPNSNDNFASTAQKIFVLPPQSIPNTGLNQNNSDDPAEIVVTVVDESARSEFSIEDASNDSSIKEKGKVLTNFSLFIIPSTYKKCFEGYRKAHDGKCRLIIKLRSRSSG